MSSLMLFSIQNIKLHLKISRRSIGECALQLHKLIPPSPVPQLLTVLPSWYELQLASTALGAIKYRLPDFLHERTLSLPFQKQSDGVYLSEQVAEHLVLRRPVYYLFQDV